MSASGALCTSASGASCVSATGASGADCSASELCALGASASCAAGAEDSCAAGAEDSCAAGADDSFGAGAGVSFGAGAGVSFGAGSEDDSSTFGASALWPSASSDANVVAGMYTVNAIITASETAENLFAMVAFLMGRSPFPNTKCCFLVAVLSLLNRHKNRHNTHK